MKFQKLHLKCDDRVRLIKLGPTNPTSIPSLEGATGSVIGWSHYGLIDTYIVLLDTPYETPEFTHKAFEMPEVCLERI